MNILDIRGLTKKFGDFVAVDNMSLTIREGEIFGFLGANGAGKSTTINMISSLLRPTSGEIRILEKDIAKQSRFAKTNLGIVPQDLAIYEDMTAYENVSFFAGLYGLRGDKLKERAEEALEFVGLSDKAKSFPKNFSGGMKRRLNIACAIAHKPKLIIMDEPTVGIDPQSRNYILTSVRKLNESGCTIIYTSHYMEEVEEICSRIAIVDHGKIIAEGTKEQLKSTITDVKDIRIELKSVQGTEGELLKPVPGVRTVLQEENVIRVHSDAAVDNLNRILKQLMDAGKEIRSVEEQEPNLETVFLTLTGRNLRD
ncbi:ABC transporter ATP-binding protein [Paenibacillus sp. JTLBN-2024]|jgi:ABC-2 type transport system ATP-binding protein|uniref:Antibiotic ABC transporter ATP-binding protein n=1 Tax=Paenibacillus cookii TaxID=157839 RepID=A0ABQ4LTR6_9BACL|nr:ABC transporter ATP-binding protein [Paenibacillus cookii]KHF32583.1 Daunorubicin/doxorubicin resistance ATP-binding protein DrrA [Paenibacillus sp. P1XP2]GIO66665.1 antibiotic ABC transporter ATP-binding protein [Paenibacillus cookii]